MAEKKKKPWDQRDPFDVFGDFSRMNEMIDEMFEDALEEFNKGDLKRKSYSYGFSMRMGPDGKPIIREFGDLQPTKKKIQLKDTREPLVDVMEKEKEIDILAELPGVEKKDIELDATDEECTEAAKMAFAHDFIMRLPQGYDTPLSEGGGNLSQGQGQLLTIARAFLANPNILVLDEATSSVDTRTEKNIQTALARLMSGRTSFVIAHRLSTIADSDNILALDHGRIVDWGPHEELLEKKGFYYNLWMSQFKEELMKEKEDMKKAKQANS